MAKEIDLEDDAQVVTKVLLGSTQSFATLVEKYQGRLVTFSSQMLSSKEAGRDAAQEAFVKAFKSLKHFRADAPFGAWLFQIARNHCIDLLRRRKRQAEKEFCENVHSEDLGGIKFSAAIEAKDLTEKILSKLPDTYREVILLSEAHDMTYEEIAKITKTSVESVKGRLKRARKEIIEIMQKLEDNY